MVKIICDSACDIKQNEAKELNIEVIPIKVNISGVEYLDGVDLSSDDFFKKLIESSDIPKTSQIPPFEWQGIFEKNKDEEVVVITMSKKLSNTYNSVLLASKDYPNVTVVDSENVTIGERILVKLAAKLRDEGKTKKQIVKALETNKGRIRLVALLDTLEYLRKGGRISVVTAVAGKILQIKPVIEIFDGKVRTIGKAMGSKNGNNMLRKKINDYDGIDFDYPCALAYSGLDSIMLDKYVEDSIDLYPEDFEFDKVQIGSAIGTHIGPGGVAFAFFKKEN